MELTPRNEVLVYGIEKFIKIADGGLIEEREMYTPHYTRELSCRVEGTKFITVLTEAEYNEYKKRTLSIIERSMKGSR